MTRLLIVDRKHQKFLFLAGA